MPRKRTKPGPKPFRGQTMVTLSHVIPRATRDFLDAQAAERGISRSNLVRSVLLDWEERQRGREARGAVRGDVLYLDTTTGHWMNHHPDR